MDTFIVTEDRWSIEGILPRNVPFAWPFVWPLLEPSINTVPQDIRPYPQDIVESLHNGARQLWICWDKAEGRVVAAVVTEIIRFPDEPGGDRVCHIWAAGGIGVKRFVGQGWPILRAWAAAHGCVRMTHGGRKGWQRIVGSSLIGKLDGKWPIYGMPVSLH